MMNPWLIPYATSLTLCLTIIVSHGGLVDASPKVSFAFLTSPPRNNRRRQRQVHNYVTEIRQHSALGSVLSSTVTSVPPSTSYQNNNPLEPSSTSSAPLVTSMWSDHDAFLQLYHHLGATPNGLLRLEATDNGVRGVHVNRDVQQGEVVLKVPLASCLCDNVPPKWLTGDDDEFLISSSSIGVGYYKNLNNWATRLAASLLDLQLRADSASTGQKLWLSLLPNNRLLRASLPVHWDNDTLQAAHCTALELAVDSSYFARAQAVSELLDGLCKSELVGRDLRQSLNLDELCNDALDIVQTRACRLESSRDDPYGQTWRVLAPIFDFINHGTSNRRADATKTANAGFGLHLDENAVDNLRLGSLVVTASRDIAKNEELLIDYGSSARPAWKCLSSYGFVPVYKPANPASGCAAQGVAHNNDEEEEDNDELEDDENLAEVYLDGVRYEVGPSTIPYEMVEATEAVIRAEKFPKAPFDTLQDAADPIDSEGHEARLTPEVAIRIATRISDVAYKLLLQPEFHSENKQGNNNDDNKEECSPAEQLVSARLAASLRWSQHNVLLACALGLQEWAIQS